MKTITIYRIPHSRRNAQRLPEPERVDTVASLDGHDLDAIFGPVTVETEAEQQRTMPDIGFTWLTVITDAEQRRAEPCNG